MTEEKLAPKGLMASKRRIIGLVLALFALFAAALWLLRQPIAEAVARSVCADQGLSCQLSITRLDFGGVTLTAIDARAPNAAEAAVSARELVIDLNWDGPFSPRPVAVGGDPTTRGVVAADTASTGVPPGRPCAASALAMAPILAAPL